jgi:hypothetical protein
MSPPRIIAVVGMHRSGTSCLAGSLQQRGLHLGTVFTWNPHNLKGNRENAEIMQLNDAVLAASGGAWDRPPAVVTWTVEQGETRDGLVERGTRDQARWGFKDPRTLLTLPFWRDSGADIRFAGTFRHPALVAASLAARNQMPTADALSLWAHHNRLLIDLHDTVGFPLVSFDVSVDEYSAALNRVSDYLGLAASASPADEAPFLEDRLRHQASPPLDLPADVAKLYLRLLDAHRGLVAPIG